MARLLDGTARIALVAAVVLAPWFFGGVEARVQRWLFAPFLLAAACWLIRQAADRRPSAALPRSLIPLLLALLLGLLQLLPLAPQTLAVGSPRAAELRNTLMSEDNSSDSEIVQSLGLPPAAPGQPISLDPASTRADLALLVLAASAFVLGATLFADRRSCRWFSTVVVINGAALALFGLVQQLTFNGKLYWRIPLTQGGSPFGPFVNRNNGGGFLLLCLACALGVVFWAFRRSGFVVPSRPRASRPQEGSRDTAGVGRRFPWWARPWHVAGEFVARLDAWTLVSLTLAASIVAGILCSLSRGAAMAMLGAAALTALLALAARNRPTRLAWLALVAIAGVGLVAWVGMSDSVRARLGTLLDYDKASQSRVVHWRDGVRAVPDFFRVGSGLGTYRLVYQPYQQRLDRSWYYHAENQYLEALVEAGVPGLVLLLCMIALVARAGWQLVRHGPDQDHLALGLVGFFALSSQAIHAFFDFGLTVPANFLLLALLSGCVVGFAESLRRDRRAHQPSKPRWSRLATIGVAGAAITALAWAGTETCRVAAVKAAVKQVNRLEFDALCSTSALDEAAEGLERALIRRPDDAEGLASLASLQIQRYRAAAFELLCREARAGADRAALWQGANPALVHARAQQLARAGLDRTLERLRREPVIAENLIPALQTLLRARRACPLWPQVHLGIAHLSVLAATPTTNQIHLDRARQMAPSQTETVFQCGLLAFQAGRTDAALSAWQKSLALSAAHLGEILRLVNRELDLAAHLENLLPDSPTLLIQLARQQYLGPRYAALRARLLDRADEAIGENDCPESEKYYLRGIVFACRGNYARSIDLLARAVELDHKNTRWRYELALLLRQQGRLDQAHLEAKYCFHSEPGNSDYRKLLEEINHARALSATAPP